MIKFLLCVVAGGSGSTPYFIAKRSLVAGDDDNYKVLLNNRHLVRFDTGGFNSWIKASTLADGGYDATGKTKIAKAADFVYPFSGRTHSDYAVREYFSLDNTVKWIQDMSIVTSGGEWFHGAVGIIGATLISPVATSWKAFTTVPYPDHFRIYTGCMQLNSLNCFSAPLSDIGLRLGKWIISGSIQIGHSSYRVTEFEVDTGFTPLALSLNMWKAFKTRMRSKGAIYSPNESGEHEHVFYNCSVDSIPAITYKFGTGWNMSVSASSFVNFEGNKKCSVIVASHDTDPFRENLSYIGVPVLTGAIVQFNSETQSITFCQDKMSTTN